MTRIVGVHGIWNQLPDRTPEEAARHLSGVWSRCLGEPAAEVTVAYYAHHLRRGVAQGVPDPENLPEAAQLMLAEWDQALSPRAEYATGDLTRPIRQVISGMALRSGLDNRWVGIFAAMFLRELMVYFDPDEPAPRAAVTATVAEAIRSVRPEVVIAHSMGSVVAYETFWENPDLTVDLLLTIGSPLGLPSLVFPKLRPAPVDGRGRRPPGVGRWVNLADPGDLCAVPRWLGTSFDGIHQDLEAPIGVFEFHRVASYLGCGRTAEILAPYLDRPDGPDGLRPA